MKWGEQLRAERKRRGQSQKDLANSVKCSQANISRLEQLDKAPVRSVLVRTIEKVWEVPNGSLAEGKFAEGDKAQVELLRRLEEAPDLLEVIENWRHLTDIEKVEIRAFIRGALMRPRP